MKKLFLIPLLALFTCVNMWGATPTAICTCGSVTYYNGSGTDSDTKKYYSSAENAFRGAVTDANEGSTTINVTNTVTLTEGLDFKGCTIVTANNKRVIFAPAANAENKTFENLVYNPSNYYGAQVQGEVTLKDVTFSNKAHLGVATSPCTLTLKGTITIPYVDVASTKTMNLINDADEDLNIALYSIQNSAAASGGIAGNLNITNKPGRKFIFKNGSDFKSASTLTITNEVGTGEQAGMVGSFEIGEGALFSKATWGGCQALATYCAANNLFPEPWAVNDVEYVKVFATAQDHVAQIGAVGYPTLSAAVVAATDGATIDLTEHAVNGESVSISKNLTINGGTGAGKTLNCAFSISADRTLTLINVTVQPTSSSNTVTLSGANAKLILSNAHIVGKSNKYAIYNSTTTATIEVAENTNNSIVNTPGSTSSYTLYGKASSTTTIQGNGYLSVENNGTPTTTGYLFGVPNGKTATFVLDAPNATYTYVNGRNIGSGTAIITHNAGDYTAEVPVPEVIDGKNVYKVYTYTQLEAALNAASDGDVIRLIDNPSNNDIFIKIPKQIVINKSITLDFNRVLLYPNEQPDVIQIGQDASSTNTVTFTAPTTGVTVGGFKDEILLPLGSFVKVYSNLVINGGEFNRTQQGNEGCALNLMPGANVTINEGRFNGKKYVIYSTADADHATNLTINGGTFAAEYTNLTGQSSVLDIRGNVGAGEAYSNTTTINGGSFSGGFVGAKVLGKGAVLNVTGGSLDGLAYAIAGNGSAEYGGTKIKISGGTVGSETTQAAIYHPQNGQLVISGNPVIKGLTGIQMCAGTGMTGSITGGRIEAVAATWNGDKQGDGLIPDGCALSIVERDGYTGAPSFAVNGGNFLSKHNSALIAYKWADNTRSVWTESANYLQVTEGCFSSNPTEFVAAEGYTITENTSKPFGEDYPTIWVVAQNFVKTNDFTNESDIEYVELVADQTLTEEEQSAKYVEITGSNTLTVSSNTTLNIGSGGLTMSGEESTLIIKPNAVVTVGSNGINNNFDADNLVLEANGSDEAGILLVDPDALNGTQPLATVSITTKAKQKRGTNADPVYEYIWEYFAMPMTEITTETKPTNNGSSATLFAEQSQFITGVYTWGGNDWTAISRWTDVVPFKGYQLTNNSADGGVTYTFKGHLIGIDNGEYTFTSKGYGYFGNSYTAPIVISNFLSALDNAVYERTVWLYDAGADTYVSVNPLAARLGSAKYKDGTAIKEIRSLQAFILNKKNTGAGTATVNYRDAIWNNPRINSLVATANPAPARHEADEMLWTNIYVSANGNKEMVTLIEDAEFTSAFDNGADAGKYINNNGMNLYAATNEGELAIVATDNLENTLLTFKAGEATEYTLSFENSNEDYVLRDNVTNETITMVEGTTYTFSQAANSTVPARFEVIAIAKMPTAIDNIEETAKVEGIYTITGQYMGRDFTKLPAGVYVVNGVKIVK